MIGWRGVAATGALPIITSLIAIFVIPESVRWLLSRGRSTEARLEAAKLLGVEPDAIALPTAVVVPTDAATPFSDLWRDPARFWWIVVIWTGVSTGTYGISLWGPTILSQLLHIAPAQAARYFIFSSLASIVGRVLFSVLPMYIGRRRAALLGSTVAFAVMVAIALWYREFIGGVSVFAILIVVGAAFYSGLFSNITPYAVEVFPVSQAARAFGLAQAANGVGKILGPLCLALIAGSNDLVSPKATADSIAPAFVFLAVCELAALIALFVYRKETHGRALELNAASEPRPA